MEVWLSGVMGLLCNQEVGESVIELVLEEVEALGLETTVGIGEGQLLGMKTERHKQKGV